MDFDELKDGLIKNIQKYTNSKNNLKSKKCPKDLLK